MKLYLKMFVAVFLIVGASSAVATEPDVYNNPTAGIQVTKPAEWSYLTAAQNLDNIKAAKFNNEEFHAALQKYATAPLVAMTKYPLPFDDINPSFKVNLKPFAGLKGKSPEDIISLMVPQFKSAFQDFVLVQPPTKVVVSRIESAYARMNYTMEVPDGRAFHITSEIWIVPRRDYFFIIGAGTRQDERTGSREEIQSILATLKID